VIYLLTIFSIIRLKVPAKLYKNTREYEYNNMECLVMRRKNLALIASSVAVVSIHVGVSAQELEAEHVSRIKSRVLEEVVVTAQKREESQQEVPIAIQAFGGGALSAFGIEDTTQLGRIVPSLQFTEVIGYTLIYLRGVGTDAFVPSSDPSVATYIDGVYMPSSVGVFQSFGGVERVEVVKGPQGSLFGRNSTGGAISVITKRPNPTDIELELSAELSNFNGRRYKAYLSTPVTDWLSISVSGISYRADEYYQQANRELPPVKTDAGRVKISFRPTEEIELELAYFKSQQVTASSILSENNSPSTLGSLLLIQPSDDDYYTEADFPAGIRSEQEVVYGSLFWQVPWFDVKVIGSDLHSFTTDTGFDFDGSAVPIAAFTTNNQLIDYQTLELQFLSNDEDNEWFEWIAGLYYMESTVGYDPGHLFLAPNLVNGLLGNVLGLPSSLSDPISTVLSALPLDSTPLGSRGVVIDINGLLGTKSQSAFAQTTVHATNWLDVTLGGRYQEEERFLIKSESSLSQPDGGGNVDLFKFPLRGNTVTNFSPKVVLSSFPIDDVMIYLSWSKGFKSATYNLVSIYEEPDYVEPEEVTQYELGVKSEWLDGGLRFNAAIFQTTIDNLQSGFVSLLAGGAVTLENAGQARIEGAEFDATIVPFTNWNPGFVLNLNMGFLDAKYTDFSDGAGYDETTGLFTNNLDFTGNDIVRTPEMTGGVAITQAIALGDKQEIEVGVDYYYNSGFSYTPKNSVNEPDYTLINGRLSYFYIPLGLRLTVFGKNLENTKYHYSKFQTDFGVNQTLSAPRQYGVRFEMEY
jgi:iron complex outermembrane receptor protein